MNCPNCEPRRAMRCTDSRKHHLYVRWRRYQCKQCGVRISTLEMTVEDLVGIRETLENVVGKLQPLPRDRRDDT